MLVIEPEPGIKVIDREGILFAVLKGEFVVESCSMFNMLTMCSLREQLIKHGYIRVHRTHHKGNSFASFECVKEFIVTFQGRGSYKYEVGVYIDTFFKEILNEEAME